ncbi:MAG: PAS domain-containing protein [wastewater metagenome]|nr:PAS domain-containing protein [Candidatus Loosdrechtia aerotolerans]
MCKNKYNILLEDLPLKIFYKDRSSTYISCNEKFARFLDKKVEEITGKTDYDLFPEEIAKEHLKYDNEVIESGQRKDKEQKYVKNKKESIFHTIEVPVKNEKGDIIGILGLSVDITEKVIFEKDAELSRHFALIGELAAGVAHEINNPITGVINCAQIILNKSNEGSREKDLASRIIREENRNGIKYLSYSY